MKKRRLEQKTEKTAESLGAVHTHTHTHTHTCSFTRDAQAFIKHKKRKDTLLL